MIGRFFAARTLDGFERAYCRIALTLMAAALITLPLAGRAIAPGWRPARLGHGAARGHRPGRRRCHPPGRAAGPSATDARGAGGECRRPLPRGLHLVPARFLGGAAQPRDRPRRGPRARVPAGGRDRGLRRSRPASNATCCSTYGWWWTFAATCGGWPRRGRPICSCFGPRSGPRSTAVPGFREIGRYRHLPSTVLTMGGLSRDPSPAR